MLRPSGADRNRVWVQTVAAEAANPQSKTELEEDVDA